MARLHWLRGGLALALALLSVVRAQENATVAERWDAFKQRFGKTYNGTEDLRRLALFQTSLAAVLAHQDGAFTLQLYNWSDWTPEEFRARRANTQLGAPPREDYESGQVVEASAELVAEDSLANVLDWRCSGSNPRGTTAVTPVKDQGNCGSCWAYTAGTVAEGAGAVAEGKLLDLSVQQLVDCNAYDYGCSGGTIEAALGYYLRHGVETTEDYPTTNKDDGVCAADESSTVATASQLYVSANSEYAVMSMLNRNGPVTAVVKAGCSAFQHYKSGVLTQSCTSSCNDVDHAITLVGYGYDNDLELPYFIAKNSWGNDWGESGYIRMLRTGDGIGLSGLLCENYAVSGGSVATGVEETYGDAEMNALHRFCNTTLPNLGDGEDDESPMELLTGEFLWALILGVILASCILGACLKAYIDYYRGQRRYLRHQEPLATSGNLAQGLNPDEEQRHAAMALASTSSVKGSASGNGSSWQ